MKKRGKEADYERQDRDAGRAPIHLSRRNHQQVQKDAADRASIVAALERQVLAKGDKALVGQHRLSPLPEDDQRRDHFAIDPDNKIEDDKVRRRSCCAPTPIPNPLEAMLCYKQPWTVEQDLPHRQAPLH